MLTIGDKCIRINRKSSDVRHQVKAKMKQLKIEKLSQPLPLIARDKIEELIQSNGLECGDKLPKEAELARMLGVSRMTVREALRLLEEDGVIVRRQGRGTFVRSSDLIIRNPLEVNTSVTEVIESKGLKAGTAWFKLERTKADKTISSKLNIEALSPVIILQRVRTANEKPAVYTLDVFSESIVGKMKVLEEFDGSLSKLLEEKYNQKIEYSVSRIVPILPGAYVLDKLKIGKLSPVLLVEEVDYNSEDKPIMCGREYWVPNILEFTILRKRRR